MSGHCSSVRLFGIRSRDLQAGVTLSSIARFIPGNTVEVLISAIGLRYCFEGVPRLNSVRALAKYSLFAIRPRPVDGNVFECAWYRPRLLDGMEDCFFIRSPGFPHPNFGVVELGDRGTCIDAKIACPSFSKRP